MAKTIKITSGKQVISIESDNAGVPDVTDGVGPDMIKLQDDAMAAPNAENAEFNAAVPDSPVEKEEKPQEATDKSNESAVSFMDLRRKHIAQALSAEGFALTEGKMDKFYPSYKAFLNSNEAKGALEEAKAYAAKKGLRLASKKDISSKDMKQKFLDKIFKNVQHENYDIIEVSGVAFIIFHMSSLMKSGSAPKENQWARVFVAFVKEGKEEGTGTLSVKYFAKAVHVKKDYSEESFENNFSVEDDEEEKEEAENAANGEGESTDDPVTPEETDNAPAEAPAEEPAPAADPAPETPAETPAPELNSNEEGGDTCPACGGDGCDNCDGDGMVNDGAGDVTESDGVTTIDTGDTIITITTNDSAEPAEEEPAPEATEAPVAEENDAPAPAPAANPAAPAEGCDPKATAEEAPVEPAAEPEAAAESEDAAAANASIESFFAELGL